MTGPSAPKLAPDTFITSESRNLDMSHKDFIEESIKEAISGVQKAHGGPFGAVIVRKGKVIVRAHNEVFKNKDPTCHAEINAIRKASKRLGSTYLSDCVISSSCEPCPMCLSAILWARMKRVYFAASGKVASKAGFSDKDILDTIRGRSSSRKLVKKMLQSPDQLAPFVAWKKYSRRRPY